MGISIQKWACCTVIAFALTPAVSFALPGEADAVVKHCGIPSSEDERTSAVDGQMQRTLSYNGTLLRFESQGGGWAFVNAWDGHLPISRAKLEAKMPCFRDALAEVAATPQRTVDPTIAAQENDVHPMGVVFGMPFLTVIGILVVAVLLIGGIPSARRMVTNRIAAKRRKPSLEEIRSRFRFRRKIPRPTNPL